MSGNTDKRSGIFQFPAKGRGRFPPLMIFMHKQPVKVPVVINIAKTDNFSVFNSHKEKCRKNLSFQAVRFRFSGAHASHCRRL